MKIPLSTSALALAMMLAVSGATAADAPESRPAQEGPRGLMRADTNGDGKVSREEAAALHDKLQDQRFDKTDANQDGFLSEDEIRKAHKEHRGHRNEHRKARMDKHFQQADANQDSQLSLDEVQAKLPKLAERFGELDADKNGLLSKEELKRGHGARARSR